METMLRRTAVMFKEKDKLSWMINGKTLGRFLSKEIVL
jgi:hypothetical protein